MGFPIWFHFRDIRLYYYYYYYVRSTRGAQGAMDRSHDEAAVLAMAGRTDRPTDRGSRT